MESLVLKAETASSNGTLAGCTSNRLDIATIASNNTNEEMLELHERMDLLMTVGHVYVE